MKSCAITGHRPARFKWKYKENDTRCKRLKKKDARAIYLTL